MWAKGCELKQTVAIEKKKRSKTKSNRLGAKGCKTEDLKYCSSFCHDEDLEGTSF